MIPRVVRVAFAVRPPGDVVAALAALPRPELAGVQWTVPDRWIVKLRPLGHVPPELFDPLVDAVTAELDGAAPVRVTLGPATVRRYSGQQLSAPITGLDDISSAIFDATAPIVPVTHPQPFHAEIALAHGRIPKSLAGTGVRAEWMVTEVGLIADRSSPRAVKLADVAMITLNGAVPSDLR